MAEREEIVEESSSLESVHSGLDEGDSVVFGELCGFLDTADVLAGGGVVGH